MVVSFWLLILEAAWKAPINLNLKEKGKAHEFEDLSKGKISIMGIRNFKTNRVSLLYSFNFMKAVKVYIPTFNFVPF